MIKKSSQKKPEPEKSDTIPFDDALRRMLDTPPKPKKKSPAPEGETKKT